VTTAEVTGNIKAVCCNMAWFDCRHR